jgi:hypothetical protein
MRPKKTSGNIGSAAVPLGFAVELPFHKIIPDSKYGFVGGAASSDSSTTSLMSGFNNSSQRQAVEFVPDAGGGDDDDDDLMFIPRVI